MEFKYTAVAARAKDYNDYDKLLTLITPEGIKSAVMRGVKRPAAKLKPMAVPFAFGEYSGVMKGDLCVVTGAVPLGDLFALAASPEGLTAASIIAEAACATFSDDSGQRFVNMLKRLQDILFSPCHPYVQAVRFLQYIIHDSGYAYEYNRPQGRIDTPLKLLAFLHFNGDSLDADIPASDSLLCRTLKKILDNFEGKFEVRILSRKLI